MVSFPFISFAESYSQEIELEVRLFFQFRYIFDLFRGLF